MISGRPEAALVKNSIEKMMWLVVISAIMTCGCAGKTPQKTPAACVDKVSETTEPAVSDSDNAILSLDKTDSLSGDEDFDLLEEELAEKTIDIPDPLESFNLLMYSFNDTVYFRVLKPVVQFYTDVTPRPVRIGIQNCFCNITTPGRYVNCLLQGKNEGAKTELDRFLINTTEGILGFGDPAKDKHGLEPVREDLGQTLAVHGIGNGFYLVLPLLGPSTARDAAGRIGDLFLNPVFYVGDTETAIAISTGRYVNESSFLIGEYESFKALSVSPYVAMRQAYIQFRNRQIQE